MGKIQAIVVKEIREALPATLFFLFLFHMIALTKAVSLEDYSLAALRAVTATVGALIVAKAILVVEALPMSRWFSSRRMVQVLWKTLLYSVVVVLFKVLEEAIPLAAKHGGFMPGVRALYEEVSWPLLAVLILWIVGGLFAYSLAFELVRAIGPGKIKDIFFGVRSTDSDG